MFMNFDLLDTNRSLPLRGNSVLLKLHSNTV